MLDRNIGARLRKARLDKNMTIDELQQLTKIQKRYLEAVEADNLDALPGTFYVRAFIRQIAEAVGEDGDELIDIFDGKDLLEASKAAIPDEIQVSRKEVHEEEESAAKTFWTKLPMIVLGAVALVIVAVVATMMLHDNQTNRTITPPEDSVIVEKGSSVSKESKETGESSSTETSTTASSDEPKMAVTFDEESGTVVSLTANEVKSPATLTFVGGAGPCWIGVQSNGAYIYQYPLTAGETQTAEIPEGTGLISITLGASGNVSMKLNDEDVNFNPNSTATVKRTINLTLNYHQDTQEVQ